MQERDENLKRFCTDKQWEILKTYWESGNNKAKTAKILGIARQNIQIQMKSVERKAAQHGYAPEFGHTVQVPDGYKVQGTSTLYGEEGETRLQWVKTNVDRERQEELMREIVEVLADDVKRVKPRKAPKTSEDDLMTLYPIGDHHLGMYSWDEEAGDDYNMEIAERLLKGSVDYLVDSAPKSKKAAVIFLGDYFHYDSMVPVTPEHKNQLDTDTRFPNLIRVAVRTMRYVVERSLDKHEDIHVIVEIGNHDPVSALFMAECLANIYENEPRVTVDRSPKHYHYFEFGKNLIGVHHGHKVKIENLPFLMAVDQKEAWGRTKYRYWWTGHIHKDRVHDYQTVRVESVKVLPPSDAWAHKSGYRSNRGMISVVLHKEHGEVSRHTVRPEMLE